MLIVLALTVLALFGLRTISNSDFWIHLSTGRAIAESGWLKTDPFSFATDSSATWTNPSWLYDAALYRLWQIGGATAATIAFVACVIGAFLLLLPVARRGAENAAIAFALFLIAWLFAPVLAIGPHGFALLALAFTLRVLAFSNTRKALLILVPLQILWTNIHPSFLLGPLVAALYCWESARNDAGKRLAPWLPLALLVATLANPYGLRLHFASVHAVFDPNTTSLLDWISPYQGDFAPFIGRHANTLLLIVVASGFLTVAGRLPFVITTLGVIGAFTLVMSPRYFLFSGLLLFPFSAYSLQGAAAWLRARMGTGWAGAGRVLLALASLITLVLIGSNYYYNRTGSSSTFGVGIARDLFPEGAAETILNRPDFPARAINLAHDGGYLAWKLPDRKIFTDSRSSVYGIPFYQSLGLALAGQPDAWNAFVEQHDPGAIILSGAWPGAGRTTRRLVDTEQWGLAYWDGTTIVLVHQSPENAKLLADTTVQTAGIKRLEDSRREYEREISSPLSARNNPALIGASQILLSLARLNEAQAIFSDITRGSPTYALAWQGLGICLNQGGELDDAIVALNRAVKLRPKNIMAWLWLERSYQQKGDAQLAAHAKQKAHRLNTAIATAFENVGTQPAVGESQELAPK